MTRMSEGPPEESGRADQPMIELHLEAASRILSSDDAGLWPGIVVETLQDDRRVQAAHVVCWGSTPTVLAGPGTGEKRESVAAMAIEALDEVGGETIVQRPGHLAARIDRGHAIVVQVADDDAAWARGLLESCLRTMLPSILAVERGQRLVNTARDLENHRVVERRISERLSAVRDVEELGAAVKDLAIQLFDIEFTGIYFRDPGSHLLRLVGAHGLEPEEVAEAERTAWQRHPGRVIRNGETILVDDTRSDDLGRSSTSPARRVEVRSRCYLPVETDGEVVGTLGLASSRPRAFGKDHIGGLEFLAGLAGLTWSRLLEQRRRETRDQILIASGDAAERLLGAMRWEDVLPGIMDMLERSFKAETAWYIAADGVAIGSQGRSHFPTAFVDAVARGDHGGITGRGDAPAPGFEGVDPRLAHPWVAVPIISKQSVRGVLLVVDKEDGRVHDSHSIAALRAFGEPLAAKISRDELEERVSHADRMELLGQMAGGVAHDINNLLMPILGLASTLAIDEPDPTRREKLEDIQLAAQRGRDFVEQVLLLTKRRVATDECTNLPEVVREAVTLLRPSTAENIRLEARVEDEGIGIIGDRTALLRLTQNLITNARHAIHDSPGSVTVTLRKETGSGTAVLEVRDDGSGMPEEVRARLFDPFFTTRRSGSERGLGLTIVQRVVNELGGEIAVESRMGEGSIFRVRLPSVELAGSPGSSETVEAEPTIAGTGDRHILVVDDDDMVRMTTEALVESLGYRVSTAEGGEAALRLMDSERFALVLSDLTMPGMDGLELIEEIRRRDFTGAAAVFTGYGEDAIDRAAASGVDEVLRKPISRDDLGKAIARLIERSPA